MKADSKKIEHMLNGSLMTIPELSKRTGIPRVTLYQYRNGERDYRRTRFDYASKLTTVYEQLKENQN